MGTLSQRLTDQAGILRANHGAAVRSHAAELMELAARQLAGSEQADSAVLSRRLRSYAGAWADQPGLADMLRDAAAALDDQARELADRDRQATAAEGYDSDHETHRRLVKLLEYVTGAVVGGGSITCEFRRALEEAEDRLTAIIRDMPANRTREHEAPLGRDHCDQHPTYRAGCHDCHRVREGG